MLIKHEGRIIIGKDDPLPFCCPDCGFIFASEAKGPKVRCSQCRYSANIDKFRKRKYVELGAARVIAEAV